MPKPRQRVCLNQGLKLDLNKLRRHRFGTSGFAIGSKRHSVEFRLLG